MVKLITFNEWEFTETEKLVINKINENPICFINGTISEIARVFYVSDATISRTIKRLGFKNIKKMQLYLYEKLTSQKNNYTIKEENTIYDIIANTKTYYYYTINESVAYLNDKEIQKITTNIMTAKKIYIFGVDESYHTSKIFANNLNYLGFFAQALNDIHSMLKIVNNISPNNDFLIIFNNYPNQKEVNRLLSVSKVLKLQTCLITGEEYVNINIPTYQLNYKTHDHEKNNFFPYSNKIGELFITDIIFSTLYSNIPEIKKKTNLAKQELNFWDADFNV